MRAFGIYFMILTFVLLLYYIILILVDVFKKGSKMKDLAESFDVSGMVDTEMSTEVHETSDGGFRFGSEEGLNEENGDLEGDEVVEEGGELLSGTHSADASSLGESSVTPSPDVSGELSDGGDTDEAGRDGSSLPAEYLKESFSRCKEEMTPVFEDYQHECTSAEMEALMLGSVGHSVMIYAETI